MRKIIAFIVGCACLVATAFAQTSIRVEVRNGDEPVAGAGVTVNGATLTTDAGGIVTVGLPQGGSVIAVRKDGFLESVVSVDAMTQPDQRVVINLTPLPTAEDTIVVGATRTDTRLEDQPMRVEVLDREEIEEKMLMTPGDIVMMLNEMGGMRVQTTSPSLGAASVRVQGMRGRYTRFLSDGLPLFGEQVGALGLLQIPPMDLRQVEVIKGVASSLYGAGAMGGVVNLISRRPDSKPLREFLINRSTRGGTDAVGWYSGPLSSRWGLTVLGSGHWQERTDVDHDSWSDLPGYTRGVFRPRLFWNNGQGSTFFATTGVTLEDRNGGTGPQEPLPVTGSPYVEALETRRFDAGMVGQTVIRQTLILTARGAVARQRHRHQFGEVIENDSHRTAFGEVTLKGAVGRHTWVVGAALEHDAYRPRELQQFSYTFTIPGVFVQDDVALSKWFSISASGRLDSHSEYGVFFSPRLAALVRSGRWSSRFSVGTGFFGPSALVEETEAAGLSRLTVPAALVAERGRSASLDVTRTDGPLTSTMTVFGSRVAHPIHVSRSPAFELTNASAPTTNVGTELLASLRLREVALTASYTYVRSREDDAGREVDAPLTPRHSTGLVGMWEREAVGRIGVEWYVTGAQRLEENPYRQRSAPYHIVGLLAERQLGRYRLFINAENLGGVRQSHWDPLIRPTRAADGRWTVDAWAPLEGRNINGGLRLRF